MAPRIGLVKQAQDFSIEIEPHSVVALLLDISIIPFEVFLHQIVLHEQWLGGPRIILQLHKLAWEVRLQIRIDRRCERRIRVWREIPQSARLASAFENIDLETLGS